MTQLGLPDPSRPASSTSTGSSPRRPSYAAAWKETFDAFLRDYEGEQGRPFDAVADYDEYVDGRPAPTASAPSSPRAASELPGGDPGDPPDARTVHGLGNRKNELLLERIRTGGVEAYEGTLRCRPRSAPRRLRTAIVSSSANCRGRAALRRRRRTSSTYASDGVVGRRAETCRGKPRPDTFLAAARDLGVEASRAAVFEDALAGMDAGRAGGFGYVVGVDRTGQRDLLYAHGADIVVQDLAELGGKQ